jgi:Transposase DDE domain
MERELWPVLYRIVREVGSGFSQKYVQIPSWILVLTMLWAALHDRPVSWACRSDHWRTTNLCPWRLPSAATMSRRVDKMGVGLLMQAVEQRLRNLQGVPPTLIAWLDGKPLPVSSVSKDPDARRGRGAGGMAKGYKLHTIWTGRPVPETWEITPLNTSEKVVARRLIPQMSQGGYILADGYYDANALFDSAGARGYQFVTPLPRGKAPGSGHHYQSPYRLRSIELMQNSFGKELFKSRTAIERAYGNATSFGGGLSPLPAWVRGLDRVRTWVWAKLLINAARILRIKDLHHP